MSSLDDFHPVAPPYAATLAMVRPDGSILTSPVWYRQVDDRIEIVIAEGDPKLMQLRLSPRCVFLAFETTPPFRGLRIEAEASLEAVGVREARLAIATRYLGADDGQRYVEQRTTPGVIVRLPLASARRWDVSAILPTRGTEKVDA
jgi:hypothetical protein